MPVQKLSRGRQRQYSYLRGFLHHKAPRKGTRLGLPAVYGVVRPCGGYIQVDSRPGAGTTLQLYFPSHPSRLRRETPAAPHETPAKDHAHGLTELLADDESSLRAAVAEYLRAAGPCCARVSPLARQVAEFHPQPASLYMSVCAGGLPEADFPSNAALLQKPFRFVSLTEQLKLVTHKS